MARKQPSADFKVVEPKKFKPLNRKQAEYAKLIETSTIVLCDGTAGSGKTFVPLGVSVGMMQQGRIEKIVLCRPAISCGEELGFLPGNLEEKYFPFLTPCFDALSVFLGSKDLATYLKDGRIQVVPLALMRGMTFDNSVVIADECQNMSLIQIRMLLSRIGLNTRMVLNGDVNQSDLRFDSNPFAWVVERLQGHPDIGRMTMTPDDVVRHGIIKYVLDRIG